MATATKAREYTEASIGMLEGRLPDFEQMPLILE